MGEVMVQRKTDPPNAVHFHAERYYTIAGLWYFLTREGLNVGPFETKESAEVNFALLLHLDILYRG